MASTGLALEKRRETIALTLIWGLLFLNTLPFIGLPTAIPIPNQVGTAITQFALVAAFGLALILNPRVVIRPNVFLLMMTLLCVIAVMTSLHNEFLYGSVYRAVRYSLFVAVLWLLTPLWGRFDRPLLKAHTTILAIVLGSVIIGLLIAPGAALSFSGRLSGSLWPMAPTQVAHYSSVFVGILSINWLTGLVRGRWALALVAVSGGILMGTHTRTAVLALAVGLGVAVASLFLGYVRVRRVSMIAIVAGFVTAIGLAPLISAWFLRGQNASEAWELTGRTGVWQEILASPRGFMTTLAGSGMSNGSFNGRSIDSNWVATFVDHGLIGITIQTVAVLMLFIIAAARRRGPARAVALFLVVHFVVSSFTEVGLNAPTSRLLDLIVAASLLARPMPPPHSKAPA